MTRENLLLNIGKKLSQNIVSTIPVSVQSYGRRLLYDKLLLVGLTLDLIGNGHSISATSPGILILLLVVVLVKSLLP